MDNCMQGSGDACANSLIRYKSTKYLKLFSRLGCPGHHDPFGSPF